MTFTDAFIEALERHRERFSTSLFTDYILLAAVVCKVTAPVHWMDFMSATLYREFGLTIYSWASGFDENGDWFCEIILKDLNDPVIE